MASREQCIGCTAVAAVAITFMILGATSLSESSGGASDVQEWTTAMATWDQTEAAKFEALGLSLKSGNGASELMELEKGEVTLKMLGLESGRDVPNSIPTYVYTGVANCAGGSGNNPKVVCQLTITTAAGKTIVKKFYPVFKPDVGGHANEKNGNSGKTSLGAFHKVDEVHLAMTGSGDLYCADGSKGPTYQTDSSCGAHYIAGHFAETVKTVQEGGWKPPVEMEIPVRLHSPYGPVMVTANITEGCVYSAEEPNDCFGSSTNEIVLGLVLLLGGMLLCAPVVFYFRGLVLEESADESDGFYGNIDSPPHVAEMSTQLGTDL